MTETAVAEVKTGEVLAQSAPEHNYIRRDVEDRLWTTTSGEWPEAWFQKGYGVGGTARSIMRLSVALACMDVLSQDVAKAPLQMRRYLKNRRGSEIVGPGEHPLARLLDRRPSRYFGWNEFIRIMTLFLVSSSEYYVAGRRRRDGDLTEIQGFDKSKVTPLVEPNSRGYWYDIRCGSYHDQAQFGWAEGRQSEDVIAHIRTRSLNGFDMLGTEKLAATAFDMFSKMQTFQRNIFSSGGMPPMAFIFPDEMSPEQWARLKDDIDYQRDKAVAEGRPFILEGNGIEGQMPKIEKLGLSTVDSDFVKANESAAMDVVRSFRVPPHKVFLLNQVKYDNQDAAERQYVDSCLVPYFRSIQECLEPMLLTESEREDYCLSFDIDAAAGMDPQERQKMWESRWKSGMCEYDEAREGIGLNAAGGKIGRTRMMSGNFVLLDQNNEVIVASGGQKPGDTEEKPPGEEGADAPQGEKLLPDNVVQMRGAAK